MDRRSSLNKNDRLAFPGLECVIDAAAGRGSGVLAYTGYYPDREDPRIRHRVLIRELFPYDPSEGIHRSEGGALQVLGAFHETGYLHLDVSPDNILVIGNGDRERVTLIDYNSVLTLSEIRNDSSASLSMKDGYTSPEVRLGRRAYIGPQSDLFSMTAVFWHCLSGRKLSDLRDSV